MLARYAAAFVDPYSREPLVFEAFEQRGQQVVEGVFVHPGSGRLYALYEQVPVFIENRLPAAFARRHRARLLALCGSAAVLERQVVEEAPTWSFSAEWDEAFADQVSRVWGQTRDQRLAEHFADTQTQPGDYPGLRVLDVGCGNGILCRALGELGATVFGIDYSHSVFNAQAGQAHPNVCFLQADLHHLPFAESSFDLVYSNGVIHHTPDTETAFAAVLPVVRPGGTWYVWLYKRGERLGFNLFLYGTDALRYAVRQLPPPTQKGVIDTLLWLKAGYNRLRGCPLEDPGTARLELYDTLTPAYKYYHTPEEVYAWHRRYGLTGSRLTHVNPYGFGVMGVRT